MRSRALARLALGSWVAVGALSLSILLGHVSETPVTVPVSSAAASAAPAGDAQQLLEQASGTALVDESKPHRHVVDPETGGLVSVAGLDGVVPQAQDLGPVHLDPVPADADLSDPTDTGSLLDRAGVVQAALAAGDQPISVGATAPLGTPGIRTLGSHVVPSCSGTGTDGKRVQVLYLHETSTPSRLVQVLPVLLNEVAEVDDVFAVSAAQTGGDRRVRWVHDADCLPVITDVAVPAGSFATFNATVAALEKLGYTDRLRKYLAFADANLLCGIGTVYDDTTLRRNLNDGYAASYARVDANCWSTSHSVAAHELTHNLGGVQPGAPHRTANGHCTDESDLMCYADAPGVTTQQVCPPSQELLLDCNHDDYFDTSPAAGSFLASSWNVASSGFLDLGPNAPSPASAAPLAATPASAAPAPTTSAPARVKVATRIDVATGRRRAAATLRTATGQRVTGVGLVLQRRAAGTVRWNSLARPRTDRTGHVSVAVNPKRRAAWRWAFAGDNEHQGAIGRTFRVRR